MASARTGRFVALFHHRWAVPILAELHRGAGGAKFVTLVHRLGIGRDSLRRTLAALIERGWVKRNPGHGHPLRPEYLLTAAGARLAPWCARLTKLLHALQIEGVALRKWSMPVAYALGKGAERFSELKVLLAGSTPRALVITLKQMQQAGLVERVVSDGYPPATSYLLTPRGRKLVPLLERL